MKTACRIAILLCVGACAMPPALAERADRDKPVHLEADRITVDEAKKTYVLEGNVQLVRGTIVIRTAKLVVTQDAEGFQRGVAYGGANGLAYFRQKREGKDEYIEGEAERIDHDGKNDKIELFDRAHVKSGLDEVSGQYISYDGRTENYVVTSGPRGTSAAAAGKQDRVRAVIQPRNAAAAKPAAPAVPAAPQRTPTLKPSLDMGSPRQE